MSPGRPIRQCRTPSASGAGSAWDGAVAHVRTSIRFTLSGPYSFPLGPTCPRSASAVATARRLRRFPVLGLRRYNRLASATTSAATGLRPSTRRPACGHGPVEADGQAALSRTPIPPRGFDGPSLPSACPRERSPGRSPGHLGDDPLRSAANRISRQIAAAMNGRQDAEVVELKKSPA